jgi:hypothetical protein
MIIGSASLSLLEDSHLGEATAMFTTCSVLLGLSLLYVLVRVQNIIPEQTQLEKKNQGCLSDLARRLKDLVAVAFKAREGWQRTLILINITCFLLYEMPLQGGTSEKFILFYMCQVQ